MNSNNSPRTPILFRNGVQYFARDSYPGPHPRRITLLSFVSSQLTTFSRLLVLLRFLRQNPELRKLVSLGTWLELQNDYWTKSADGLFFVANDGSIPREANWDIARAVDVLSGNIRGRLPGILWSNFGLEPPGSLEAKESTGARLRDLVSRRLGPFSKDSVPSELSKAVVKVSEYGVAELVCEGKWSCALCLVPSPSSTASEGEELKPEWNWRILRLGILVGSKSALLGLKDAKDTERDRSTDGEATDPAPVTRNLLTPHQESALLIPAQKALDSGLHALHAFLEKTTAESLLALLALSASSLKNAGYPDLEITESEDGEKLMLRFWTDPAAVTVPEPSGPVHASTLVSLEPAFRPSYHLEFETRSSEPGTDAGSAEGEQENLEWPPLKELGLEPSEFKRESIRALSTPGAVGSLVAVRAWQTMPNEGTSDIPIGKTAVDRTTDPANPDLESLLLLIASDIANARIARVAELLQSDGMVVRRLTESGGKIAVPALSVAVASDLLVTIRMDLKSGRFKISGDLDAALLKSAEQGLHARLDSASEQIRSLRFGHALAALRKWTSLLGLGSGIPLSSAGIRIDALDPLFAAGSGVPCATSCGPVVFSFPGFSRWYLLVAVCAPLEKPNEAMLRVWLVGTRIVDAGVELRSADEFHDSLWTDVGSEAEVTTGKRKLDEPLERGPKRRRTEEGIELVDSLVASEEFGSLRIGLTELTELVGLVRRLLVYRSIEGDCRALGMPWEPVTFSSSPVYSPRLENTYLDPLRSVLIIRRHYLVRSLYFDLSQRLDSFEDVLTKAETAGVAGDMAVKVHAGRDGVCVSARFRVQMEGLPTLTVEEKGKKVSVDEEGMVTVTFSNPGDRIGRELARFHRGAHVLGFLARQVVASGKILGRFKVEVRKWSLEELGIEYLGRFVVTVRWSERVKTGAVGLVGTAAEGSFVVELGTTNGSINPHAKFAADYSKMLSESWNVAAFILELIATVEYLGAVAEMAKVSPFGSLRSLGLPDPAGLDTQALEKPPPILTLHPVSPVLTRVEHKGRGYAVDVVELFSPQLRTFALLDLAASKSFSYSGDFRLGPLLESGALPPIQAKSAVPFLPAMVRELLAAVDDRQYLPMFESRLPDPEIPAMGAKALYVITAQDGVAASLPVAPRALKMFSAGCQAMDVLDWLEKTLVGQFKMADVKSDPVTVGVTFQTTPYVSNTLPLRVTFRFYFKTLAWMCMVQLVLPENPQNQQQQQGMPGRPPGFQPPPQLPRLPLYTLPNLKADLANPNPDPRNTMKEFEKLSRWLIHKLTAYGAGADPRPAMYSVISMLTLPPEVLGEAIKLFDLEMDRSKSSCLQMLLTVPAGIAEENRPAGSPAIKVEPEFNRVWFAFRMLDTVATSAQNTGNTLAPSSQQPAGSRLSVNTPSPNLPGTPRSAASPNSQVTVAAPTTTPGKRSGLPPGATPAEVSFSWVWNWRTSFQTIVSPNKNAPERGLIALTELQQNVMKAFGGLQVNKLYANVIQWCVKKEYSEAEKRLTGVLGKLMDLAVTGSIDRMLSGSSGTPAGGAARQRPGGAGGPTSSPAMSPAGAVLSPMGTMVSPNVGATGGPRRQARPAPY